MKPVMDYFKHPTSKTTNQVCAQPLYICQYQGVGCWIGLSWCCCWVNICCNIPSLCDMRHGTRDLETDYDRLEKLTDLLTLPSCGGGYYW